MMKKKEGNLILLIMTRPIMVYMLEVLYLLIITKVVWQVLPLM